MNRRFLSSHLFSTLCFSLILENLQSVWISILLPSHIVAVLTAFHVSLLLSSFTQPHVQKQNHPKALQTNSKSLIERR